MQNYLYSALSSVAIAIHLIINFDLLFPGRKDATSNTRRYRGFLLGIFSYYIADVAWGIFAGLGWTRALYYETLLYFLTLAVIVLEWSRFVVTYLDLRGWTARLLTTSGYALFVFHIVMLTINFFNDCFFHFDEQGNYVVGSQRNLAFVFELALYVFAAALALVKTLKCHGTMRRRNMLVVLFGITMAVTFGIQMIWPLLPFTALGCLVGSCFFRMFVIEDERDELRQAIIEREQATKHMHELEKALERARAAEKSRSTFFSIVSHDIRTPLNAILGYSELLQHGIKTKSERSEALNSIRASGTALLQLVNDVLDLAKMDSGKMTLVTGPVRLSQLADDVLATFRLAASEKGLKLVNQTEGLPTLMLDEHRFRQILFNLIGNAVKFTSSGSITVSTSYDGANLTVSVTDTGCGIPADMLARILEPFIQVQDPTHPGVRPAGTGLGLSICKRLAEVMGGRLTVDSEPWKGSTFTITIPAAVAVGENPMTAQAPGTESSSAVKNLPRHVLVVDDSAVNRSVLKAFLKRAGVQNVDFAGDGYEALLAINSAMAAGNPHDLVFSDFWMPNMNGLEFIEKLRKDSRFAKLTVFAVTADTELNRDNDSRTRLFTDVLLKPLTYDKLLSALSERP